MGLRPKQCFEWPFQLSCRCNTASNTAVRKCLAPVTCFLIAVEAGRGHNRVIISLSSSLVCLANCKITKLQLKHYRDYGYQSCWRSQCILVVLSISWTNWLRTSMHDELAHLMAACLAPADDHPLSTTLARAGFPRHKSNIKWLVKRWNSLDQISQNFSAIPLWYNFYCCIRILQETLNPLINLFLL